MESTAYNNNMEARIVGGGPASMEQVPYNAQVFNLGAMCAATILNSWTLLTAAHCFDDNKDTVDIVVQVGSKYLYDFSAEMYNVAEVVIHEKYNDSGLFSCDIALLFVDRAIAFNSKTKKAILVTSDEWMSENETNFTVSGWGWTQYGGPISVNLMVVHLRFIPLDKCNRLHDLQMTSEMFCLYGDGFRDTCKGDSGSGVFWKDMIVGVTSHGDGCAKVHKPSVYSNVYHFREWIKREILDYISKYCQYTG